MRTVDGDQEIVTTDDESPVNTWESCVHRKQVQFFFYYLVYCPL